MLIYHASNRKIAHVRDVRPTDERADSGNWAKLKFSIFLSFIINFRNSNRVISNYRHVAVAAANNYPLTKNPTLAAIKAVFYKIYLRFLGHQEFLFVCNQILPESSKLLLCE